MGVRRARSARRTSIFGDFAGFLEFSGFFFSIQYCKAAPPEEAGAPAPTTPPITKSGAGSRVREHTPSPPRKSRFERMQALVDLVVIFINLARLSKFFGFLRF